MSHLRYYLLLSDSFATIVDSFCFFCKRLGAQQNLQAFYRTLYFGRGRRLLRIIRLIGEWDEHGIKSMFQLMPLISCFSRLLRAGNQKNYIVILIHQAIARIFITFIGAKLIDTSTNCIE